MFLLKFKLPEDVTGRLFGPPLSLELTFHLGFSWGNALRKGTLSGMGVFRKLSSVRIDVLWPLPEFEAKEWT